MRSPTPIGCCDSCGDLLLDRRRIYRGFIGSLNQKVCEECAMWHSSEQYVRCTIAEARRIIRQHQKWLASLVTP